jgi:hypothetical protein
LGTIGRPAAVTLTENPAPVSGIPTKSLAKVLVGFLAEG